MVGRSKRQSRDCKAQDAENESCEPHARRFVVGCLRGGVFSVGEIGAQLSMTDSCIDMPKQKKTDIE